MNISMSYRFALWAIAIALASCAAGLQAATDSPAVQAAEALQPKAKPPFVIPTDAAARAKLVAEVREYMQRAPAEVRAHPAAADFPGVLAPNTPRVTRTVTVSGDRKRWQSTGLYANAGEVVTVTPATALPAGVSIEIIIGCHTDSLLGDKQTEWKRFPLLSRKFTLGPAATPVANAFGGPIFAAVRGNTGKAGFSLDLRLANAAEAPFFVLGKTTPAQWAAIRNAPAPWGELVGHNMILHFPASQVRQMDDPTPLLEWWDKVVAAEDHLVGWPERTEQERVVPDRQISAGWMHSGYPFMCYLASAPMITDLKKLRTDGDWGFFHELGHNHQSPAWTFAGQTEVTVNFFSLYCMETVCGKPTGTGHGAIKDLDALLKKRFADPPEMGPFEQLGPFIVLIRKFGWAPLQATLASYQSAPAAPKSSVEERQAEFIRRYSKNAKADLSAFFKLMGYACPDSLRGELKSLPAFDFAAWRAQMGTAKP